MKQLIMAIPFLLSLPTWADIAPDPLALCSQNSLYEGKAAFDHECQKLLENKQCFITDTWMKLRGQLAPSHGNIFWVTNEPNCFLSHHSPAEKPDLGEVATLGPMHYELNGDFSQYLGKEIEIDGFVLFYTHTGAISSGTYADIHVRGITDLGTGKHTTFDIPLRFAWKNGKKILNGKINKLDNRIVLDNNYRYELVGDNALKQHIGKNVQLEGFYVRSKYEKFKPGKVANYVFGKNKPEKPKKVEPKKISDLFVVNKVTTIKGEKNQVLSSNKNTYVRYEYAPKQYTYVSPKKLLQPTDCWLVGETKEVSGHFDVSLPNTVAFVPDKPTCSVTQKNYPTRLIITPIKHYIVVEPDDKQTAQNMMKAAKTKQRATIKATVKLLSAIHEYEYLGLHIERTID